MVDPQHVSYDILAGVYQLLNVPTGNQLKLIVEYFIFTIFAH